jgi:hypothetical protein
MSNASANNRRTARKLALAAQAFRELPVIGGRAYGGNVPGQQQPIVASHYTKGNAARYGWPPLSPEYAKEKAGKTKGLKAGMKQRGARIPAGKGLPMLVATGALRDAVSSKRAIVTPTGDDRAIVRFTNLPEYAEHLQSGTAKMPARSPVDPNAKDMEMVREVMLRHLRMRIGQLSSSTSFGGGAPRTA